MKRTMLITCTLLLLPGLNSLHAEETVQMETTIIKGNKELPQILYIVPWRDLNEERREEQQLVLHSLYGELFDPVFPERANSPTE